MLCMMTHTLRMRFMSEMSGVRLGLLRMCHFI
jgi:hypothetical protein